MNRRRPFGSVLFAIMLGALTTITGGCRKRKPAAPVVVAGPPVIVAHELDTNRMDELPGPVYRSQANSPIHWQPWTKETLARAKEARRLVFAIIAVPQQPGFLSVLAAMDKDPALVAALNDEYVPVLIDGDAAREVGLLVADLCGERKMPIQLPLLLWMTSDANPVAWIPAGRAANVVELFNQSHSMIRQSWKDSRDYFLNNSALDNENRRARMGQRRNGKFASKEPAVDAVKGVRQLTSYYDSLSRTLDETGGLFPSGSLDLLATVAVHPGVDPEIRQRCMDVTRELLVDLLPSAMFDPLDGGVFSVRRGKGWALPGPNRDCSTQARTAIALIDAARATGNAAALEKALGLISFAEKNYATSEGLFAVGLTRESEPAAWMWTLDEIEKELGPEDAKWWIKATGMTALGNIPPEMDPRREYFRSNTMGMEKSMAQLAADVGQPVAEFEPRFEAARRKLLKARTARLGPTVRDDSSHAGATMRMVSAYAAAFAATGTANYRTKAVELLGKARTSFSQGPRLREFSAEAPPSVGEGRAFLYGLTLQAALDVASVTGDEKWLLWCDDLATTAAELFTANEFLKECPDDAKIFDLPVTDLVMLLDDSTAGLVSFAECRMKERKRPLVATFSELATPLPTFAATQPVLHTDLLQATLAREFAVTVVIPETAPAELRTAALRLPVRMVQRRAAQTADDIPQNSLKVILPGGETRIVATAKALQDAILPSPQKP